MARSMPLKEDFYYISLEKGAHDTVMVPSGSIRFGSGGRSRSKTQI